MSYSLILLQEMSIAGQWPGGRRQDPISYVIDGVYPWRMRTCCVNIWRCNVIRIRGLLR
jgi:hypothetical protein